MLHARIIFFSKTEFTLKYVRHHGRLFCYADAAAAADDVCPPLFTYYNVILIHQLFPSARGRYIIH